MAYSTIVLIHLDPIFQGLFFLAAYISPSIYRFHNLNEFVISCDSTESLIDVAIKLDNWPSETSWEVVANGNVIYSVPSGTYNYTQTGQTIHTQVCIPIGDRIVFTINDTYGDGIGEMLSINPIIMFNIVPTALINIIANSPISIPGK